MLINIIIKLITINLILLLSTSVYNCISSLTIDAQFIELKKYCYSKVVIDQQGIKQVRKEKEKEKKRRK